MCPACITSTAVIVAGAGSTGGLLAVCIGKFRKLFHKGETKWQQVTRKTRDMRKAIPR